MENISHISSNFDASARFNGGQTPNRSNFALPLDMLRKLLS